MLFDKFIKMLQRSSVKKAQPSGTSTMRNSMIAQSVFGNDVQKQLRFEVITVDTNL